MMTLRETFDKVKAHLLAQNCRSRMPDDSMCAYRGVNGTACAVGCLIPDEKYSPMIEGRNVTQLIAAGMLPDVAVTKTALSMLKNLQFMHDHHPLAYWVYRLDDIERKYFGC